MFSGSLGRKVGAIPLMLVVFPRFDGHLKAGSGKAGQGTKMTGSVKRQGEGGHWLGRIAMAIWLSSKTCWCYRLSMHGNQILLVAPHFSFF